MIRKYVILLLLFSCCFVGTKAQILVDPSQTAQALAQKLAGAGVTVINPSLSCPAVANGIFNVVTSNLGLDSGILLTTGRAQTQGNRYGVNGASLFLASNNNGAPGDADLDNLAGMPTHDACILEMDVIPSGDTVKFDYVFSSEEYINSTCGPYNDAFAFFISGPGINGQENMALVPGTNIPVTINSINSGIPGPGLDSSNCTMMGPGSPFTAYYIDNSIGTTLTHKGLTTVLRAMHAVTPCNTYHLKMAIADADNFLYDSGVFLKAGSLQTSGYTIVAEGNTPPGSAIPYAVKGCLPARFRIKPAQVKTDPQTVRFQMAGTAVAGTDYTPVPDSIVIPANDTAVQLTINGLPSATDGPRSLTVLVESAFSCNGIVSIVDSATVTLYDTVQVSIITPDTTICEYQQLPLFVNGYDFLTYSWSPGTGLNDPIIQDPIASPLDTTTYLLKAIVPNSTCPPQYANITIGVKPAPGINLLPNQTVCVNTPFILQSFMGADSNALVYNWAGPDGFHATYADPAISKAATVSQGEYYITVTSKQDGCSSIDSMFVSVDIPDSPHVLSPLIICKDKPADPLEADGQFLTWYTSDTGTTGTNISPIPSSATEGSTFYYVSQRPGNCESPRTGLDVIVEKCCDGVYFIPDAFTPNSDGKNDRFEIKKDYGYKVIKFNVFNRWGQQVFAGYDNSSWDGNYNGRPADMGTYYYEIWLSCISGGQVRKKGEVTLVR